MKRAHTHILLVEDDVNMGFLLKDSLEMAGYKVILCEDGKTGQQTFFNNHFHICLLDVMLPEEDGFALAHSIRKRDQHTPIIFLTARGQKEDIIQGFKLGADDYMTKPFSIEELTLRIEAVLKRTYPTELSSQQSLLTQLGTSKLDSTNQILTVLDETKSLTYRECKLLKLFFTYPNQLLERDFILKLVWEDEGIIVGRSLDVFISRLRKIIKEDHLLQITNVHGIGYKLEVKD